MIKLLALKVTTSWVAAGALLISVGCSDAQVGGGGIGGTRKLLEPDSYTVGVIDGFGSIIINGQRFETDLAEVTTDGLNASLSDLRIGMTIQARTESTMGEAVTLRYQPDVSGIVTEVDTDLSAVQILGQWIQITDGTVLDGLTSADLVVGTFLQVSGVRNADGEVVATYISPNAVSPNAFITGRVDLDPVNEERLIGGAVLDVSLAAADADLTIDEYQDLYLEPGSLVRVGVLPSTSAPEVQNDAANESSVATLTITGVDTLAEPAFESGDLVQAMGVVGRTFENGRFRAAQVMWEVNADTAVYTNSGTSISFPEVSQNERVFIIGTAQSASGTVAVEEIRFLDLE